MSVFAAFVPVIAPMAEKWIRSQREKHWPLARPLHPEESAALAGSYADDLLSSVRMRVVERMENPGFYESLKQQASWLGVHIDFDFTTVSGITFDDCVLVREGELSPGLLFHELVHVEQYRQLGIPRFARAYVQGFAENDFVCEKIPLEVIAYDMTRRWKSSQAVSVRGELTAWIQARGY